MGGVTRRAFLAAGAAAAACSWRRSGGSLVQAAPGLAPSYWSTWGAQNFAVDAASVDRALAGDGHSAAAANLTEPRVFGPSGWARALEGCRQDLYLLLDLGWDLPAGAPFDQEPWRLGSHEAAADKFPSCQGDPAERLRRLNELCVRAGWRGAGLWVAAQPYGDGRGGAALSSLDAEAQLRDRLARAGITTAQIVTFITYLMVFLSIVGAPLAGIYWWRRSRRKVSDPTQEQR